MRDVSIYCLSCRKPIIWKAYLRIGVYLSVRCWQCGDIMEIRSEPDGVKRQLDKIETGGDNDDSSEYVVET
jgi:hypothetical protein